MVPHLMPPYGQATSALFVRSLETSLNPPIEHSAGRGCSLISACMCKGQASIMFYPILNLTFYMNAAEKMTEITPGYTGVISFNTKYPIVGWLRVDIFTTDYFSY